LDLFHPDRHSGFRIPVSGFRFHIPDWTYSIRIGIPDSGFRFQIPDWTYSIRIGIPDSGFRFPVSGFGAYQPCWDPGFRFPVSGFSGYPPLRDLPRPKGIPVSGFRLL
jgi:hypothetical protein